MSFDFRLTFTGICTVVPHTDGDRLCVLLPDGTRGDRDQKRALDGERLSRHQAFLEFDPRALGMSFGQRVRAISEVEPPGGRIEFVFEGGTEDRDFTKPPDIIDLSELCDRPELAEVASWALDPTSPKHPKGQASVLCQVVIDRGFLSSRDPSTSQWYLRDTLGHGRGPDELSHALMVDVPNLTCVEVWFTPFSWADPPRKLVTFDGPDNETVELRVANLCDDNPLGWPLGTQPVRSPDIDFKWHYEVLKHRKDIFDRLGGSWLPCPLRVAERASAAAKAASESAWAEVESTVWNVPNGPSLRAAAAARVNPSGDNCYKSFTAPASFSFPDVERGR